MPDNRFGNDHNINLPRQPIANDPPFSVLRMLDGHRSPDDEYDGTQDHSNPHTL